DLAGAIAYAQTWAIALLYQLKPDKWKATTWGEWTSDWFGVMSMGEALLLADFLEGHVEGEYAQWFYNHSGQNASGVPASAAVFAVPNLQDQLLFYVSSRPQTDYSSLPTARLLDGGEAVLIVRSGWGTTDDFDYFNCSPSHYSASTPRFGGHVD